MNSNKLRASIIERGLNNKSVAEKTGIHIATFYRKLKSGNFNLIEMEKIKILLNLSMEEVEKIFLS